MKPLLEKLSQYWQLRFLIVGASLLLVMFALLLPVHSNESNGKVVAASTTGKERVLDRTLPVLGGAGDPTLDTKGEGRGGSHAWMGTNAAAVQDLQQATELIHSSKFPRDFTELIRGLRRDSEQGSEVAEFLLGRAYQGRWGVPKNMAETARWYGKAESAARQNAADSEGIKAPGSFAEAFSAYRQVAETGDARAELYEGLAYDLGVDVPRSPSEAIRWYRKASAHGSVSAESNLGVLYHDGDGVPKDAVEARKWLTRAAMHGSSVAQYCLGRMYFDGDGVAEDDVVAGNWLKRAAAQGNGPAEILLSVLYATGRGVPRDSSTAYMWMNLASATEVDARVTRDQLEQALSAREVEEGQKRTHVWLRTHPAARL